MTNPGKQTKMSLILNFSGVSVNAVSMQVRMDYPVALALGAFAGG